MKIVRHFGKFLFRKRSWYWLLAAALMALVGHWLEGNDVLQPLRERTDALHASLERVQPFQITNYYSEIGHQGGGMWLGQWVHDLASAPIDNDEFSVILLLRSALWIILLTPAVGMRVWHETGWYSSALFIASLVLILLLMRSVWKNAERKTEWGFAVLGTLALIAFGPFVAGGIAWVALQLLLLCVLLFGKVLGGLATIVSTFGAAYKAISIAMGVLRTTDSIEGHAKLVADEIADGQEIPRT